jgi:hypothetical protein
VAESDVEAGHLGIIRTSDQLLHLLSFITWKVVTNIRTESEARGTMRIILIAPENVYEHEVDPSMEIQDVRALVEAEVCANLLIPIRSLGFCWRNLVVFSPAAPLLHWALD